MKKNISKIAIFTLSSLLFVGGLLLAEPNPTIEANAAEFSYEEGRDKFELNESGDLEVTFTITYYDDAAAKTKYWTVYLLDKDIPLQYYYSHKLYELEGGRGRNRADYYFTTVGADVISASGTYTITVKHDAKAYHSDDPNPCLEADLIGPDQDTGKIFSEVYTEQDWFVCVGPMFPQWNYMEAVSEYICPIDYYVGRMDEVVPGLGHDHSWSYVANGASITASCSAADCPITSGLTLTLEAPTGDMHYDGNARVATFAAGYNVEAFPNATIKYFKNNAEVNECVSAGKYTAKVTFGNAVVMVEFEILGNTIVDPDESEVTIEVDDAVIPEDVELRVEVRADVVEKDIPESYAKIEQKLEVNEQIAKVYDVKLIQTVGGVEREIQPSDIKPGLKVKAKMAIPEGMDMNNVRILHIHSVDDMEFVDDYIVEGSVIVFEIDRLSQFAFITKVNAPAAGLNGGIIALIVILSVLALLGICFCFLFFVFAKYIIVKDNEGKDVVAKAVKFGKEKQDNKELVRLFTFKCKKELRVEKEVFNKKEDAEEFLNNKNK